MQTPLLRGPDTGPLVHHDLGKREVKLPSLIDDQCTMVAFFRAPSRLLERLLPVPSLRLTEALPGTTLVGVACMEYRHVEGLDPYNEVGIMLPVCFRPPARLPLLPLVAPKVFRGGNYFHRMPVGSPEAYDIGVKLHGLRKLLADIRFEETSRVRRCDVQVDGRPLLSLEVNKLRRLRPMRMTTQTYTVLDGQVLRTPVPTRGEMGTALGGRHARLELGNHEVADELREMSLHARPTLTMYAPRVESVLAAPAARLD